MAGQNGGIIPNNLHRVKNLNNSEKSFLFYMISLDNRFSGEDNDGFFFSREDMALELGISSLTTITNLINRLVELDLVRRIHLGKKLKNRYSINWELINRIGKMKLAIGERIDLEDMAKEAISEPQIEKGYNYTTEEQKHGKCEGNDEIRPVEVQPEYQYAEARKKEQQGIPQSLYDMIMKKIPEHIYNISFKNLEREKVEDMISRMIGKAGNMSFDTWAKNENLMNTPLWVSQLWSII